MAAEPIIWWVRHDLRLEDNPALSVAVGMARPIVPVFIWAPDEEGDWPPGAASRWWLHHSLAALERDLHKRGSRLIVARGPSLGALEKVIESTGAAGVVWNRRYEPAITARDGGIKTRLRGRGLIAESHNSALLSEPHQFATKTGGPYQVFTPFWKACLTQIRVPAAARVPRRLGAPGAWPESLALADLKLLPTTDWAGGLREAWQPGEAGALAQLDDFLESGVLNYREGRDLPAQVNTSRLSPHLHFGEIGPRQLWRAVHDRMPVDPRAGFATNAEHFLREVGWREFAHHLLFHFPHTPLQPLRPEFGRFPWKPNAKHLRAWQRGRTGYPLVDAGMRELWTTGWMHNRVRMIVASFLVKDLLISWTEGARWFWDTLVDADLANNTLGWQWTAGCGADAAPYFRIFNPTTQSQKFDPAGDYLRRWVPELAQLNEKTIHAPDGAFAGEYPPQIVNHSKARDRALAALATLKRRSAAG